MSRSTAFDVAYVGNNNTLELRGLRDERTGEYLNAATVTATVQTAAGTNLTGDTWPKTMAYVDDSRGVYQANISHAAAFEAEARYTAIITVDAGEGRRGRWELPVLAKVRRS